MAKANDGVRTFRLNTEHLIRCISADLGPSKGTFFTEDMSLEDADRLSIRRSILKKFKDVTHRDADSRAVEAFLLDNDRGSTFSIQPKDWFEEHVLGEVTLVLDRMLHDRNGCPATLTELTDLSRCGPGSSVDVDLESFYTKLFDSTLATANPSLRRLYDAVVSRNPTWARAEESREAHHGNRTVRGSKLSTVAKQFDIGRTIATEPPLEMFFQLGIGGFIESSVLMGVGINLSTQPDKNRELARVGSIDGSNATIDLRSASNSIYLALRTVFPRYFWEWLMRCRSPSTQLPNGEWVQLAMIASMGNGFCFPLQTMLFMSVVIAVYRLLDLEANFGSPDREGFLSDLKGFRGVNAGVFGDDIVVRREAYEPVIRALKLFGFQVNTDKSYNSGSFRESCGHDYFRGVNIRGVYLKTLTTRQDCYSLINRLVRWSARTSIPFDFTLCFLLCSVGFTPIPFQEQDDHGVKVPSRHRRVEWYSLTGGSLYECVVRRARQMRVASSYDDDPGRLGDYVMGFNPDGIITSWVAGYIRQGFISVRDDADGSTHAATVPKVLLREVPYWDYIPKAVGKFDLRDRSWEATIERVLAVAYSHWDRPAA